MRRQLLTIATLAVVFALGCGDAPSSPPPDAAPIVCDVEGCAPYACDPRDGTCLRFCGGPEDCAPERDCVDARCVGTECTSATAVEDCGPYACVNGSCAHDCAIGPCAAGYYCRGDTSECVAQCTSRGDPVCEGYVCDTSVGECEPYCLDGELPCAAGYTCDADARCQVDLTAAPCRDGCGAYACVEALGRCATHCVADLDCAASATCVDGSCV